MTSFLFLIIIIIIIHLSNAFPECSMLNFSKNFFLREATLLKGMQLCANGNNYAAPDCDISDSDLLVGYCISISFSL